MPDIFSVESELELHALGYLGLCFDYFGRFTLGQGLVGETWQDRHQAKKANESKLFGSIGFIAWGGPWALEHREVIINS